MSPYFVIFVVLGFAGGFYYLKTKLLSNEENDYESDGGETTKIRHEGGI